MSRCGGLCIQLRSVAFGELESRSRRRSLSPPARPFQPTRSRRAVRSGTAVALMGEVVVLDHVVRVVPARRAGACGRARSAFEAVGRSLAVDQAQQRRAQLARRDAFEYAVLARPGRQREPPPARATCRQRTRRASRPGGTAASGHGAFETSPQGLRRSEGSNPLASPVPVRTFVQSPNMRCVTHLRALSSCMTTLDNATDARSITLPSAALWGALGVLAFSFSLPATRLAVDDLSPAVVGLGRALSPRRSRRRCWPCGASRCRDRARPAAAAADRRRRRDRLPAVLVAGAARALFRARVGDRRPAARRDGGVRRRARRRAPGPRRSGRRPQPGSSPCSRSRPRRAPAASPPRTCTCSWRSRCARSATPRAARCRAATAAGR